MDERINQAFKAIPRQNFLPPSVVDEATLDAPLPIGHGQTNSQPYTVRLMLEWLDAQSGDKVLDVGSGSGWTAALLSHIVGPKGKVYAVEKVPELVKFGRQNCERINLSHVEFHQAGDKYGLPGHAPYDRILVSASAHNLPQELLDQLKVGGKMVIPVRETILEITKTSHEDYDIKEHPGFVFVPLV
jgi:protein-L-isoaspartate(D-aspartate) O-methyltransferase